MKKIVLIAFLLAPMVSFAQERAYSVKGRIGKLNKPAVAILHNNTTRAVIDTVYLKKGKFEFKGLTEEPFSASIVLFHKGIPDLGLKQPTESMTMEERMALINDHSRLMKEAGREMLPFFVEPAKIVIVAKDSIKNAMITGSKLNDENIKLNQALVPVEELKAKINELYSNSPMEERQTEAFRDKTQPLIDQFRELQKEVQMNFINENPDSWLSLTLLKQMAGPNPDVREVQPIFNALSENVKNSKSGIAFADNLQKLQKTAIGQTAPDFSQNDPDGKPIKLSDFRGKYVLIDFWASWCGPCRHENPNVVKAYQQFKDKNFTVLGVSLDRESGREDWLKAIEKDQLTWPQVSDLKFWNNEVARLYNIRAIPANLLIDPQGTIVARELKGAALIEKLNELLN